MLHFSFSLFFHVYLSSCCLFWLPFPFLLFSCRCVFSVRSLHERPTITLRDKSCLSAQSLDLTSGSLLPVLRCDCDEQLSLLMNVMLLRGSQEITRSSPTCCCSCSRSDTVFPGITSDRLISAFLSAGKHARLLGERGAISGMAVAADESRGARRVRSREPFSPTPAPR